jgi:hypothetical protein
MSVGWFFHIMFVLGMILAAIEIYTYGGDGDDK